MQGGQSKPPFDRRRMSYYDYRQLISNTTDATPAVFCTSYSGDGLRMADGERLDTPARGRAEASVYQNMLAFDEASGFTVAVESTTSQLLALLKQMALLRTWSACKRPLARAYLHFCRRVW